MTCEGSHFVYVLESARNPDRHYVGLTSDLGARLSAHNDGRSPHSAKFRPWRLVIAVQFADRTAAARFERHLKSGSGRAFAREHVADNATGEP
jgi:predicted GIY-YIG superfamily endonuclease